MEKEDVVKLLSKLSKEEYCYLTTKGRKTGRPHEIEIWFGVQGNSIYLLSGGGSDSDWVKNLRADPHVTVCIGKQVFQGIAQTKENSKEESIARPMLAAKYQGWKQGKSMSEWGRTALVVRIELTPSYK
jgi:deazaflavin-dependent oxidoreductase (nitroreductase family)